jgi:hypothetical protein
MHNLGKTGRGGNLIVTADNILLEWELRKKYLPKKTPSSSEYGFSFNHNYINHQYQYFIAT